MVDELRAALELATDDELHTLTELLFRPRFNPLDYFQGSPWQGQGQLGRQDWLDQLEARFRFLAADGLTVLSCRSQRISYRQALVGVCRFLKLSCSPTWTTADIEAEVFLHLLEHTWQRLSPRQQQQVQQDLRRALAHEPQFQSLPLGFQTNPVGLLLKGGGAVAVSALVRPLLLRHLAPQLARHAAYAVALSQGGRLATRGVVASGVRYGATRSLLAVVGPLLWTWVLADVGWRMVATNYGRVIPVVFALAQIRLTRALDAPEMAETGFDRGRLAPCV